MDGLKKDTTNRNPKRNDSIEEPRRGTRAGLQKDEPAEPQRKSISNSEPKDTGRGSEDNSNDGKR